MQPDTTDAKAARDIAGIAAFVMVATTLAVGFELRARLLDLTGPLPPRLLDTCLAIAVATPLGFALFARHRYREASTAREELARLATHDGLTGLPNRRALDRWQEQGLRSGSGADRLAVGFVDLDRFKHVNDTHGHDVGDQLVAAAAERLRGVLREGDHIVRYGGDEFVLLFPAMSTAGAADRVARRIVEALEAPFTLGHEHIRISGSVGVAIGRDRRDDLRTLLQTADAAMYEAKRRGRGTCVVIDRETGAAPAGRISEDSLREAFEHDELVLHYQPIVGLVDGSTVGVEALLRWQHPDRGLLPPGEFLPLLEESGLIVPVGVRVLELACEQLRQWNRSLPGFPPLRVTVNVAARQLAQADFADSVLSVVRNADVDAGQVCLEITESALLEDVDQAWASLRRIKRSGVLLALDDFGTGYSSLTHLRRFTLDLLKIDQTFITGLDESPEDRAIVTHVVSLAHSLGMWTAGEGIESAAHARVLTEAGCDYGQGYALGRPVPAKEITDRVLAEVAAATRSRPEPSADVPVTDTAAGVASVARA